MQICDCVCEERYYEYSGVADYDVIYILNCLDEANINKQIAAKLGELLIDCELCGAKEPRQ